MPQNQPIKPDPDPPKRKSEQPEKRRGRPEKFYKIDDTPLNVARSFFRIPSDKFTQPKK